MENDAELEMLLKQAYHEIVKNKKSIRQVSKDIGIERRTLKRLMLEYLPEDERKKLNIAIDKKNNKKIEGKDNKKGKALKTEKYKEKIEELAKRGISPNWIEQIYTRCQEKEQTKISRDTLAYKLVDLLDYFSERNTGLTEESMGYISSEDVVNMILKNPRIMTSDVKNNIIPKCVLITEKNDGSCVLANIKIKSNPGVFRKSYKTIKEGR